MSTPLERKVNAVINLAYQQLGYIEKASGYTAAELLTKFEHPGTNNYTRFAAYMDGKIKADGTPESEPYTPFYNGDKNGYDWCAVFYHSMLSMVFGKETTRSICNLPAQAINTGAGVGYCVNFYRLASWGGAWHNSRAGYVPQRGDQICFMDSSSYNPASTTTPSDWAHTGLVVDVDTVNNYVITIEGNTKSPYYTTETSTSVAYKQYRYDEDNTIGGYGTPNWALAPDPGDDDMTIEELISNISADQVYRLIDKIGDKTVASSNENAYNWFNDHVMTYAESLGVPSYDTQGKWNEAVAKGLISNSQPEAYATRWETAAIALNAIKALIK